MLFDTVAPRVKTVCSFIHGKTVRSAEGSTASRLTTQYTSLRSTLVYAVMSPSIHSFLSELCQGGQVPERQHWRQSVKRDKSPWKSVKNF